MKVNQWYALTLIGIAVLFSMSLWFSASVIAPALREAWQLTLLSEAWLSAAVPGGFVIGSLISSFFGISDRLNPRKIFAGSSLFGSIFNILIIFVDQAYIGIILRALTGVTLAGVYPPAVNLITQWFPKQRGLATGVLIAALTLGSSLPHFILLYFNNININVVIILSSLLSIIAAIIINWFVMDAPIAKINIRFSIKLLKKVIYNKPVMLANYGYFGHMWELYAAWTWLPLFLNTSFLSYSSSINPFLSSLVSFLSIGICGGIGCIIGGFVADKIGRSNLTIIAMAMSAFCAFSIGLTYGSHIWLTILFSLLWGSSVIADSAQFSAAVSEFADREYIGTALTFQMCIGFLFTIVSINIIPWLQTIIGWEWVFIVLSIGPVIGIFSMIKLRSYENAKLYLDQTS
ncbi:MFS transporter [Siminovitchia sediminis]|uniref:MFS transporter n=1 Tax=Siminovitchia sediminis TaxID=1274353 RepID=A0ABW4KM53_9BACI